MALVELVGFVEEFLVEKVKPACEAHRLLGETCREQIWQETDLGVLAGIMSLRHQTADEVDDVRCNLRVEIGLLLP